MRQRKRWIMLAVLLAVIAAGHQWWKQGKLVSEQWSPNKQYVVREYKTFEFIPRMTMPGDGGHYSGYMRVYNRDGKQFYEEYSDLLDFIEGPFWRRKAFTGWEMIIRTSYGCRRRRWSRILLSKP